MQSELSQILAQVKSSAQNIKDPRAFDLKQVPERIYIRPQLKHVLQRVAEYIALGIPSHLVIYGWRGSGKSVSMLYLLRFLSSQEPQLNSFYLNARENPSSYKIYQALSGISKLGFSLKELRSAALQKLQSRCLLVLDEADFLEDLDLLYHLPRFSQAMLILLTQKVHWYSQIQDEAVRSSLAPESIIFQDYTVDELTQILSLRAQVGLEHYQSEGLGLIAAHTYRDFRSDARIAIRALFRAGLQDDWSPEFIRNAVELAGADVERETIKGLRGLDLMVLYSVLRSKETNQAYRYLNSLQDFSISKPYFFRILNHLQNLGMISLIRKRSGKYCTLEVHPLISDESLVVQELQARDLI